jgi:hypothetical protein
MHDPEAARAYTMKIGRVYFDIQPPPSMMSMMENGMVQARVGHQVTPLTFF